MSHPLASLPSDGFPLRPQRPETQETWYLNSLLYLKPGTIHRHCEYHSKRCWGAHMVDRVDVEARRMYTFDDLTFGYCEDGRWRRLNTAGGVDSRFEHSFLELPQSTHPHLPLKFVVHPVEPSDLRPVLAEPRVITTHSAEAQYELDRIEEAEAAAADDARKRATAQAYPEGEEEWHYVTKPVGDPLKSEETQSLMEQAADSAAEALLAFNLQQEATHVGHPSSAAAGRFQT